MTDHHELPAPARPAGLDALLDHVAAGLPVDETAPTVEQSDRIAVALAQAEQEIRRLHAELAARPTRATTLREGAQIADRLTEQYDDLDAMKAAGIIGPHTMAGAISTELRAQAIAAERDERPRIEVDLDQPAAPAPIEAPAPAVPTVVPCAHGYGLMRDSCPGCDAEQERPHQADPVTIRPEYAKRDMRRCRRCSLVPSHAIHRAAR